MYLDEIFSEFDLSGLNGVCNVLSVISERYSHIIMITHNEYVKSMVDVELSIKNEGVNSSVVCEKGDN